VTISTNQTAPGLAVDAVHADTVEEDLLTFLEKRTRASWAPDVDLFESGAVSSLFAMQLVVYLEKTFGVIVAGDDLTLENFRTVRSMTTLVRRLRAPGNGGSGE
jgi:methoxymalonate biosynthesis acyl carrier protein